MRSRGSLVSELIVAYFIRGVRAVDGSLRSPALQPRSVAVHRQLAVGRRENRGP